MQEKFTILVADDDADDRLLIEDAFQENECSFKVDFVVDGVELMDYLTRKDKFSDLQETALPKVILLDLNMPRKDGRTALEEIKNSEELRNIPVVILTTSNSEEDISKTYGLGVNSFITKPVTFEELVDVVKTLTTYWLEIVELPVMTTESCMAV